MLFIGHDHSFDVALHLYRLNATVSPEGNRHKLPHGLPLLVLVLPDQPGEDRRRPVVALWAPNSFLPSRSRQDAENPACYFPHWSGAPYWLGSHTSPCYARIPQAEGAPLGEEKA